jgi:uncharacterized protein YjbI with pentapeptide repeats
MPLLGERIICVLNSCVMAVHSPTGQSDEHAITGEERCQRKMWGGHGGVCGRPILQARQGADKEPVCLMHSSDPQKNCSEFQAEFERVLQEAGDGLADFSGFVFPSTDYRAKFAAECCFADAKFVQDVNFASVMFRKADFARARFERDARFDECFFGVSSIDELKDYQETVRAVGKNDEKRRLALFLEGGDTFSGARFMGNAIFRKVIFIRNVHFSGARFEGDADFEEAEFSRVADFSTAQFHEGAAFLRTLFHFGKSLRLYPSEDPQRFPGKDWEAGPTFVRARFEKPEKATFYLNDMRHVLFHSCDVSRLNFSNVSWRLRSNGKRMVLEEAIASHARSDFLRKRRQGQSPNYTSVKAHSR